MRVWLLTLFTFAGCVETKSGGCTPGQTIGCACDDGSSGNQTCNADGTFGACACRSSMPDLGMMSSGKRVFVTSQSFLGDFAATASSGTDGADAHCQTAADAIGLAGTFTAWVSIFGTNAIDRISGSGPWFRMDGTKVFNNRANLMTAPLAPINLDESGNPSTATVWTGTDTGGMSHGVAYNCQGWSQRNDYGIFGDSNSTAGWTDSDNSLCGYSRSLYCFEN